MLCTRCSGTGFINLHQVDDETLQQYDETLEPSLILDWIRKRNEVRSQGCTCAVARPPCLYCESFHDVYVCDCCGNGEDWYGEPGQHDLNDTTVPFPQCY